MHAAMTLFFTILIVVVLVLTTLQMLIPRLTRRDIWFAVTVSPGFRDTKEARAIAGRYRLIVGAGGALALAIVAV